MCFNLPSIGGQVYSDIDILILNVPADHIHLNPACSIMELAAINNQSAHYKISSVFLRLNFSLNVVAYKELTHWAIGICTCHSELGYH